MTSTSPPEGWVYNSSEGKFKRWYQRHYLEAWVLDADSSLWTARWDNECIVRNYDGGVFGAMRAADAWLEEQGAPVPEFDNHAMPLAAEAGHPDLHVSHAPPRVERWEVCGVERGYAIEPTWEPFAVTQYGQDEAVVWCRRRVSP